MEKKSYLILICIFITSMLQAQNDNQKEVLDTLHQGQYRIEVFYYTDKKVGYEITKNSLSVSKEIIEPQPGSTLGSLKTKAQFKSELMKMAKFVLQYIQ